MLLETGGSNFPRQHQLREVISMIHPELDRLDMLEAEIASLKEERVELIRRKVSLRSQVWDKSNIRANNTRYDVLCWQQEQLSRVDLIQAKQKVVGERLNQLECARNAERLRNGMFISSFLDWEHDSDGGAEEKKMDSFDTAILRAEQERDSLQDQFDFEASSYLKVRAVMDDFAREAKLTGYELKLWIEDECHDVFNNVTKEQSFDLAFKAFGYLRKQVEEYAANNEIILSSTTTDSEQPSLTTVDKQRPSDSTPLTSASSTSQDPLSRSPKLAANSQLLHSQNKQPFNCTHCFRPGHSKAYCFKLYPHHKGGRTAVTNTAPICDFCMKAGHLRAACDERKKLSC